MRAVNTIKYEISKWGHSRLNGETLKSNEVLYFIVFAACNRFFNKKFGLTARDFKTDCV